MMSTLLICPILATILHTTNAQFGYSQEQLNMYDLYDELQRKYETPTTFYEFLNIEPDANKREIKKGYRNRAVIWHPDKADKSILPEDVGNADEYIESRFRHLTEVNEVLIDPELRESYDDVLKNGLPPGMSWRYVRYFFKLSVKQVCIFMAVVVSLVQYLCIWGMYLEKKWIVADRSSRSKKKAKQMETIVVPPPTWRDTLPVLIFRAMVYLVTVLPGEVKASIDAKKQEQLLAAEQREQEAKYEIEAEEEKKRREEQKKINQEKHGQWVKSQQEANAKRYNKLLEEAAKKQAELDSELAELDDEWSDSEEEGYSKKSRRNKKKSDKQYNYGVTKELKTGDWTESERQRLVELMNKWPGGTPDRYERIAEELCRTPMDVTKQLKIIKTMKIAKDAGTVIKESKSDENAWSQTQQKSLEEALLVFKKDYKGDRWEEISKCVYGKTKAQCIERYKFIVIKLKEAKSKLQQS